MSMAKSWSLSNARDNEYLSDSLPYALPEADVDTSIDSFSIAGLSLDRSVSAPPNQGIDLSLIRNTWRNNNSLHSLTGITDDSSEWADPTKSRLMETTTKDELLAPLTNLPSLLKKEQTYFIPSMSNLRDINHGHGNSRSEPVLAGVIERTTSPIYTENRYIRDQILDEWNSFGVGLRRPASTGVIGRNSNQKTQQPILAPIQSLQRESPEFQKIDGDGDLSSGITLNVSPFFHTQQPKGRDPLMDSSIFGFEETNNSKNKHKEEKHIADVQQRIIFDYPTSVGGQIHHSIDVAYGMNDRNLSNMTSNTHSFQRNHQPMVDSISTVGQSQHSTYPIYPPHDFHHIHSDAPKMNPDSLLNNRILHHPNAGMTLLNPPGYAPTTIPYRSNLPPMMNPTTYHEQSTYVQSHSGQISYMDPTINSGLQHNYYTTMALPGSLHHDMVSTIPPSYAYFVFQPQQHQPVYSTPSSDVAYTSSHKFVRVQEIPIPNIHKITDRDTSSEHTTIVDQGLSHGRSDIEQQNKIGNLEKDRRNNSHKNGFLPNLDPSKKAGETSSLLDEFRAAKNQSSWTSFTIKGHIAEFSQDQNGSRFIQQRLEVAVEQEKELILEEILIAIKRIRNDVFGNYVVQKILQHGSSGMKSKLVRQALIGEVIPLSKMMYGCRVIQKALECIDHESLFVLVFEFKGKVVECILDQNGNHVIQKCIEVYYTRTKNAENQGDLKTARLLSNGCQFLIDESLTVLQNLSCHPYGCRIIQRIIEHSAEPIFSQTLDTIVLNHRPMIDDQFGNYVIQHLLQYGRTNDKETIMNTVLESGIATLSRQKYASNVVEKLLKFGTSTIRGKIIMDMLKEEDCLLSMVRDAYANYVVQTALDVAPEGQIKKLLLQDLSKHSSQLRNYTFAKHIVNKLGG